MFIFPRPLKQEIKSGDFCFSQKVYLHLSEKNADKNFAALYKELWSGFTAGLSAFEFVCDVSDDGIAVLTVSDELPRLNKSDLNGYEYIVESTNSAVYLTFDGKTAHAHAMSTLLQMIQINDTAKKEFGIGCCKICDKPSIKFRGIHLCLFPESSFELIEKTVRLCGLLKYTHVVLEFWGTLRYDCLDVLGWKDNSYSKDTIRKLVATGNAMGIEFIPMFNHLGHAPQSRSCCGKHTVLDQDPTLEKLFEPDGWTWCVSNPDTLKLLKDVRAELIELFGEGKYFHIGCDEAYTYATCDICSKKDKGKMLADYINGVAEDLASVGRQAIMWADMTLGNDRFKLPYCVSPDAGFDPEEFLKNLSDDIIHDDWQYDVCEGDYLSGEYMAERHSRKNIIASPWGTKEPIWYLCRKVKEMNLGGILETTWNRLSEGYGSVMMTAVHCWQDEFTEDDTWEFFSCHTAKLLRKLKPANGNYENSGYMLKQM